MTDHPPTEALIRSPLGEIRVWIDADAGPESTHAVRSSIRVDYDDEGEAARRAHDMARVVGRLAQVVRGLANAESAPASAVAGAATFAPWLAERTEPDPTARTLIRHLHQDYVVWCDRSALPALPLREFGQLLSERGFTPAGLISQGGYKGQSRGGIRVRLGSVAGAAQ